MDLLNFLNKRQEQILRGEIGHDAGPVAAFNRAHKLDCIATANKHARADKSDPFVRSRVLSHLSQGITELNDYELEWGRERAYGAMPPHKEVSVDCAMNRKVPCI